MAILEFEEQRNHLLKEEHFEISSRAGEFSLRFKGC